MEKFLTPGTTFSQLSKPISESFSRCLSTQPVALLSEVLGKDCELFLVGGAVRDLLEGYESKDIDLAVSSKPELVEKLLAEAGIRVIETGIAHGTLTALVDGHSVEITTFRKPGPRNSGLFSDSIEEDLSGRDFTINAIAVRLSDGEVVDPFNGYGDLQSGLVRAVGSATDRFKEDPLRLMRMVRFGPACDRTIDVATFTAAGQLAPLIDQVTPERIREELNQILLGSKPHAGIQSLHECGLLTRILPECEPSIGFEQNDFHIHDVFEHTLWVLERSKSDLALRLACLFHDLGKPATLSVDDNGKRHFYSHEYASEEIAKSAMERLHYSKKLIKQVGLLISYHMRPLDCGPAGVRRLLRDLGEEFDRWLLLKQADAPPVMPEPEFEAMYANFIQMVEEERARRQSPLLAIGGEDLIRIGFSPGPRLGRVLKQLGELIIEEPDKNYSEYLIAQAEKMLSQGPRGS